MVTLYEKTVHPFESSRLSVRYQTLLTSNLATRTLNDKIDGFAGYRLRMRWRQDRYQGLRNGAWMVRNSRTGQENNPLAVRLVVVEAVRCSWQPESPCATCWKPSLSC